MRYKNVLGSKKLCLDFFFCKGIVVGMWDDSLHISEENRMRDNNTTLIMIIIIYFYNSI